MYIYIYTLENIFNFYLSLGNSAYWKISVDEKDRQRGLFEFNRMPFGLVNAPTTFQRTMDSVTNKNV
jgi:hypothetical protein